MMTIPFYYFNWMVININLFMYGVVLLLILLGLVVIHDLVLYANRPRPSLLVGGPLILTLAIPLTATRIMISKLGDIYY